MTKVAGVAASYAPQLGLALVAAGPLLSADSTVAYATCAAVGAPGTYECSGTITTRQVLRPPNNTALTVSTTEQISIITTSGDALDLRSSSGSPEVRFTDTYQSTITGFSNGISVDAQTAISITTTGAVTGTNGRGITAYSGAGNITISAASVTGNQRGISVLSRASGGDISITATGDVSGGVNNDGINTYGNGIRDTTISAATVSGGRHGVSTRIFGTGAQSITTSGDVTGTTGRGIYAFNSSTGTDLTINAAKVTGQSDGINADQDGSGALSITTTGDVTGKTAGGIGALNSSRGTNLTINAAKVTGQSDGIFADQGGSGALSITASGDVTGTNGHGINASNSPVGTDLTINAARVAGGVHGISAYQGSTGALSITASGDVTGATGRGINARNTSAGTDLTITAVNVTGGTDGIYASNVGTGTTTVTSTGLVSGSMGHGIHTRNASNSAGTTISAAAVTGSNNGIYAQQNGSGALSITATGDVTGTMGTGIYAFNSSAGTDLTINAGKVTGGGDGIYALQSGTGALSITTSGDVTGGSGKGTGIRTSSSAGTVVDLTLNGGTVSAASGNAIRDGSGNATVTVNTGSAIVGSIQLADGSDTLVLAGGDVSGVTSFNGGDDSSTGDGFTDIIRVTGSTALAGGNVTNFERLEVARGGILSLTDNLLTIGDGTAGSGLIVGRSGTLSVAAGNKVQVTGETVFESGSQFRVGIASDTDTGSLTGTGGITFENGSEVYADLTQGIQLTNQGAIQIASATGGVTDNGLTVDDNSALIDFTHEVRGGNSLFLIVEQTLSATEATTTRAGSSNARDIAAALDVLISNAPSDNPIVAYLAQFPVEEQEAQLVKLVEDTLPSENGSTGSSTVVSTDMVLDLIMDRLSGGGFTVVDSGERQTGVAAGEQFLGGPGNWALWGRAGASFAAFDPSGVNGFDSDTYAVSLGLDGDIAENLRMGLAVFYSDTKVDETGAGANSSQDIEGYGVLLYGTYRPEDFYVNATIGYGQNEYDSRRLAAGGVNRANYDGTQFMSRVEVGKVFTKGAWDFSPHVGLRFNKVSIDGYTETGPLPTSISSQSLTSLRGVLGLSGRYTHTLEGGAKLIPEVYVRGLQELADPNEAITGNVVGGGSFISQSTKREKFSYAAGAGLTYEMDDHFSVRFLYDGEFQTDYQEHSITAAIRYQF